MKQVPLVLLSLVLLGCSPSATSPAVDSGEPNPTHTTEVRLTPETGSQAVGTPTIPGVKPEAVVAVIQPLGLTCTGPEAFNDGQEWKCRDDSAEHFYDVRIYGDKDGGIHEIVAMAGGPTSAASIEQVEQISSPLFVALANLATNGTSANAADWVTTHLSGGTDSFGGVVIDIKASDDTPDGPARIMGLRAFP